MPVPAYVPDMSAHVRLIGNIDGVGTYGVGFWTPCTEADPTHLSTFAGSILAAFGATVMSDQGDDANLEQCRVLSYQSGVEYAGLATGSYTGLAATAAASANCCTVVDWLEGVTYRGGHPRTYLWGTPLGAIGTDARSLTSAYRSALTTEVAAFLTAFNALTVGGAPAILSCLHRVTAGVPLTPGYLSSLYTPSISTILGTQRRRLGR